MNKIIIPSVFYFFIFIVCFSVYGQKQLKPSTAEKYWAISHLPRLKKAIRITREVQAVVDSLAISETLGKNSTGGTLDAFRHAFWMYRLAENIGCRAAKSLGEAHEKGNYQFFKKKRNEDGVLPDQKSSLMDLYNNGVGLEFYKLYKGESLSKSKIIQLLISQIRSGKMKILLKNSLGEYLNCNGKILDKQYLKGKWKNDKCLVASNRWMYQF